jgi:hypothetical protein
MPRPVERNGGDKKGTGGTGKFKSNPLYGTWKQGMREFKGNLAEQRIVQGQTTPKSAADAKHNPKTAINFQNDLFPDSPISRNSKIMTPGEKIPGKPQRNVPFNRSAARNISARQTEANNLNKTIAKVRRTNAAK